MNKPQAKFAKPWQDCLTHDLGLKKLLERANKQEALTSAVKNAVDSLGFGSISQSLTIEWRPESPNELVLVVPNSTIGTRLQQIAPSIAREVHSYQWVIHHIRVKIKPSNSPIDKKGAHENLPEFTQAAQTAWEDLYQRLSPQSSLRESIARLLKNRKIKR